MSRAAALALTGGLLWACGGQHGAAREARQALDAEYAAAERAFAHHDHAAARAQFSRLVGRERRGADRDLARYRLAQIALAEGHVAQARAAFEALVADGTPERRALARAQVADLSPDVEAGLRALVEAEPDSVAASNAVRQLALHPLHPERDAALVDWLAEVSARFPDREVADNAWWYKAHVELLRLDDLATGRATLRALVRRWPDSPLVDDALWALITVYRQLGAWDHAVAACEGLFDYRNEQSYVLGSYRSARLDDAALLVGDLHYHARRDWPAAAAAYARLLDEFETSVLRDDAWWGLAQARLAAGDEDGGRAALISLRAEAPRSRWAARAASLLAEAAPRPVPSDPRRVEAELSAALGVR